MRIFSRETRCCVLKARCSKALFRVSFHSGPSPLNVFYVGIPRNIKSNFLALNRSSHCDAIRTAGRNELLLDITMYIFEVKNCFDQLLTGFIWGYFRPTNFRCDWISSIKDNRCPCAMPKRKFCLLSQVLHPGIWMQKGKCSLPSLVVSTSNMRIGSVLLNYLFSKFLWFPWLRFMMHSISFSFHS